LVRNGRGDRAATIARVLTVNPSRAMPEDLSVNSGQEAERGANDVNGGCSERSTGTLTLPAVDAVFRWSDETWGAALRCRPLEDVAEHLFTTRQLELRPTADGVPAHAAWAQATAAVGGSAERLLRIKQVHGRTVRVVREETIGPDDVAARPEADALVSNAAGAVLAVQVADCVPVLMADRRTGVAAAVHAGWRGTSAGITRAAVEALAREFSTEPRDLTVAIGPSIGACCYEVGDELLDEFRRDGAGDDELSRWFHRAQNGRLQLDLWTANREQLVRAGVSPDRIFLARLCTQTHAGVFDSYRAAGAAAGRMAALIRVP